MRYSYCKYCRHCRSELDDRAHRYYGCYAKQMEPIKNISECPKKDSLMKRFVDFICFR